MITCYFVLIPINKSISDAPNRLIGLYQSAVVVIAIILLYKTFLRKKRHPLDKAIKNCRNDLSEEKWVALSEEEKQDHFYTKVVKIIHANSAKNGEAENSERTHAENGEAENSERTQ